MEQHDNCLTLEMLQAPDQLQETVNEMQNLRVSDAMDSSPAQSQVYPRLSAIQSKSALNKQQALFS